MCECEYCVRLRDCRRRGVPEEDKPMKYTLCGYCEYGYRLFMAECGKVCRFPIPLTEIY